MSDPTGYDACVAAFRALSDPTRLQILDMLSCGEQCACELLEAFQISQSTLSYHMKILTESGLVDARRDGTWMRYTLNRERIQGVSAFYRTITQEKDDCICRDRTGLSCGTKGKE